MDKRVVLQLAASLYGETPGVSVPILFALADDGTMWRMVDADAVESVWERMPDLPEG